MKNINNIFSKKKFKSYSGGFTLIELMIVVAIIGILSSLALTNMKTYSYRAKRAEAHVNLQTLHMLQVAVFEDSLFFLPLAPTGLGFGTPGHPSDCNTPNDLGFVLKPCTEVRFQYSATVASNLLYTGQASSLTGADNVVFPNCTTADIWSVTESRQVMNDSNGMAACL